MSTFQWTASLCMDDCLDGNKMKIGQESELLLTVARGTLQTLLFGRSGPSQLVRKNSRSRFFQL